MAQGQLTFLKLVNRVLLRLGKPQVSTLVGVSTGTDSWPSMVMDLLNDAQAQVFEEHDWSTRHTTGTFTSSVRTYTLSTSFSGWGRTIDLTDTTNKAVLDEVSARDIDEYDPGQAYSGPPTAFALEYPNLLFSSTPTSISYRLRYLTRPTAMAVNADLSTLPESCDQVLIAWVYWQLLATREDAKDGGVAAKRLYDESLRRAMAQDDRRIDRLHRMQSVYPARARDLVPFPPEYDRSG